MINSQKLPQKKVTSRSVFRGTMSLAGDTTTTATTTNDPTTTIPLTTTHIFAK